MQGSNLGPNEKLKLQQVVATGRWQLVVVGDELPVELLLTVTFLTRHVDLLIHAWF